MSSSALIWGGVLSQWILPKYPLTRQQFGANSQLEPGIIRLQRESGSRSRQGGRAEDNRDLTTTENKKPQVMQIDSSRSSKTREQKNHALKALFLYSAWRPERSSVASQERSSIYQPRLAWPLLLCRDPRAHEQFICNIRRALPIFCLRKR